jgi:hypothetical protein
MLYTDDDDFNVEYQNCIALNGINVCAREPDLLDRSILLQLERISTSNRKTENQFWKEFEPVRPLMLGAIFDALSKAISLRDKVQTAQLNRMADFEEWGCAIAQAMGYTQKDFVEAYGKNVTAQNEEALNESDVATAIIHLLDESDGCYESNPSSLLKDLTSIADNENIDTKNKYWPKKANVLTRRINEIKSNLFDLGVEVNIGRDGRKRWVKLKNTVTTVTTVTSTEDSQKSESDTDAFNDDSDDNDGFFPIYTPKDFESINYDLFPGG